MIDWEFNAGDYDPNGFLIPKGKYRVRIEDAEETISKSSGKPMVTLTLKVSGHNSKIWYYLVFNPEKREYVNQKLGELLNSFNISKENSKNPESWKGKVGGANIKHEPDNNGNMQARVSYFLNRKEVDKLPAWQEGKNTSNTGNIDAEMYDPFN